MKHGIKIFIIIIWLTLMGWWWAESRTWPVPEKIDMAFLPDYNDYFSLYYKEQKIGWSYKTLRRLPDGNFQASQSTEVKVLFLNDIFDLKNNFVVNLDKSLKLLDFTYIVQVGDFMISESGEAAGGRLSIGVNLGAHKEFIEELLKDYGAYLGPYVQMLDFSKEQVINLPDGPGLANLLSLYISYLGMEKGRNYDFKTLDPGSRSLKNISVKIDDGGLGFDADLSRDVPAFQLLLRDENSMISEMRVDRFGRVFTERFLDFHQVRELSATEASKNIEPFQPPSSFQKVFEIDGIRNIIKTNKEKAKP